LALSSVSSIVETLEGSPSLQNALWYGTVLPGMSFSEQMQPPSAPALPEQSSSTPVLVPEHCAVSTQVGALPVRLTVMQVAVIWLFVQPKQPRSTKGSARMGRMSPKVLRQVCGWRQAEDPPFGCYARIVRPRFFPSLGRAGIVLCAVMMPSPSAADPILAVGGGDALSLQADQLDIDVSAGDAVLTGNVTLSKGDLKVSCPRIELKFDPSPHVKWARGSGGVAADVRGVHAEAPDVELDLAKQVLDLRGGVRLSRGQGWLQADRATIDVSSGKVTMSQVKGSVPVPPPK
jgi:lipopolysaccharide export system protein LptA